ncbi:hypothetical protein C0J52_03983 [Blattella germanica]|nr:hypothetical protein C0J52_03983 [Blattella germanica]
MRRNQIYYEEDFDDNMSITSFRSSDCYEQGAVSPRQLLHEGGYNIVLRVPPLNHRTSSNVLGRGKPFRGHTIIVKGRQSGQFEEEINGHGRSRFAGRQSGQFEYEGVGRRSLVSVSEANVFPEDRTRRLSGRDYGRVEKISWEGYSEEDTLKIKLGIEKLVLGINNDIVSGQCTYCKKVGSQFCKRCDACYCSRDCQLLDWPDHKFTCKLIPVPDLVCKGGSTLSESSVYRKDNYSQHSHRVEIDNAGNHELVSQVSLHAAQLENGGENLSHATSEGQHNENRKYFKSKSGEYTVPYKQNSEYVGNRHNSYRTSPNSKHSHYRERDDYDKVNGSDKQRYNKSNSHYRERDDYDKVNGSDKPRYNKSNRQSYERFDRSIHDIKDTKDDWVGERCKNSSIVKNGSYQDSEVSVTKDFPIQNISQPITENRPKVPMKEVQHNAKVLTSQKLPADHFKKVKITVAISPNLYWVQIVDLHEKLVDIMSCLNDGSDLPVLQKVEEGTMCAAHYVDDLWYRGLVTKVKPELKVLYFDFGNEEHAKADELRSLPGTLCDTPAMAIKMKLANGTPKKYESLKDDEELSVKCVGTCDDMSIVQIEGELYDEVTVKPNPSAADRGWKKPSDNCNSPPIAENKVGFGSIVMNLKVGSEGGCQFQGTLAGGDFSLTLLCPEVKELYKELFDYNWSDPQLRENYEAHIGEIVAVECDEDSEVAWQRARVLSFGINGYRVILCDNYIETIVKEVHKLPERLMSIPEFGARCTVVEGKLDTENYLKLKCRFTVNSVDKVHEIAMCTLKSGQGECLGKVVLRQWVPVFRASLKDNDRVKITLYFDQRFVCVREVSEDSKELFSKIEKDVHLHCTRSSSDFAKEMPGKNEIVGCKFADGIFYRAKIVNIDKEEVKVLFIDYGNLAVVRKTALKLLPPSLRNLPAQVTRVCLKDVPSNEKMPKKVISLFGDLIDNHTELKVHLLPSMEGVELILPDGRNLNELVRNLNQELTTKEIEAPAKTKPEREMVKECNERSQKPAEKERMSNSQAAASDETQSQTKVFTESDLNYLSLPVGETVQLAILHKVNSTTFMACDASNTETYSYVTGTMSENLNKYCESISETYEPKVSELCFAKFEDGCWYRGLCLQETDASTKEDNIYFIDYGNTAYVEKENMRKMTSEYLKTPVLASLFIINTPDAGKAEAQEEDGGVEVNKIYEARIISCEAVGSYIVDVPEVKKH